MTDKKVDKNILRKAIIFILFFILIVIAVGSYVPAQKFLQNIPAKEQLEKDLAADLKNFTSEEVEKIEIGKILDLPDEKIREAFVTFKDRKLKSYLHLSPLTGKIVYANLGDTNEKSPVEQNVLITAKRKALKFADNNKELFDGYRFAESGRRIGVDWPKKGYITYVWQNTKDPNYFIKVTLEATSLEIVSFGRGNINWTSFCLPSGFKI